MSSHLLLTCFRRLGLLTIAGAMLASMIVSKTTAQVPQTWSWSAEYPEASFQSRNPSSEKLFQALRKRDSFDMKHMTLKGAMTHLADQFGIQILIDEKGLEEETITVEEPIDISLSDVPLGHALHWILSPLNLTYSIQSEVLLITSISCSSECLVIYDVTWITVDQESTNGRRLALDLYGIMRLVENSISADQWQNAGGTSTIEEFRDRSGRRCLAILAKLETHQMIEAFFSVLAKGQSGVGISVHASCRIKESPGSWVRSSRLRRAIP